MPLHPPVTAGYLRKWLEDSKIPDDAVITTPEGMAFRDIGESTFWTAADGDRPAVRLALRWGQ